MNGPIPIGNTPCGFCAIDLSRVPSVSSLNPTAQQRLRNHLIQFHAPEVANGFLHPDPSNRLNCWLNTCADYTKVKEMLDAAEGLGETGEEEINPTTNDEQEEEREEESPEELSETGEEEVPQTTNDGQEEEREEESSEGNETGEEEVNQPSPHEPEEEEEGAVDVEGIDDSGEDMVNSTTPQDHKEEAESLDIDGMLDMYRKKHGIIPVEAENAKEEEDDSVELEDISNEDRSVSDRSSNSPPERKRKRYNQYRVKEWACNLCTDGVMYSKNALRHALKKHLPFYLFACPLCNKFKAQEAYRIRDHLQKEHGNTSLAPLSRMEEKAVAVKSIYDKCFPGRELRVTNRRVSKRKADRVCDNLPNSSTDNHYEETMLDH